jgi:hypothetical protein
MAPNVKQIIFAIVVTYLGLLILFKFVPSTTATLVLNISLVVFSLSMLVASALMKSGKLKQGSWWGHSAIELFLQGMAFLIIGLGNFSENIFGSLNASKVRLASAVIGLVIIIVAVLLRRRTAKPAAEI